jgi:glycosyltransferase involved in cell wall biosynthesis
VVVGRNNKRSIRHTYDSIARQNYSNYRVVHIDDKSSDGTTSNVLQYLESKPDLSEQVTLVTQPYRRNALYNRNYGVMTYCRDGDIVVDVDADDWLIGNQVLQLVNSIYQAGIYDKTKK